MASKITSKTAASNRRIQHNLRDMIVKTLPAVLPGLGIHNSIVCALVQVPPNRWPHCIDEPTTVLWTLHTSDRSTP